MGPHPRDGGRGPRTNGPVEAAAPRARSSRGGPVGACGHDRRNQCRTQQLGAGLRGVGEVAAFDFFCFEFVPNSS
jgi:hypothetical protein